MTWPGCCADGPVWSVLRLATHSVYSPKGPLPLASVSTHSFFYLMQGVCFSISSTAWAADIHVDWSMHYVPWQALSSFGLQSIRQCLHNTHMHSFICIDPVLSVLYTALTLQFVSHTFQEDHDPTIGTCTCTLLSVCMSVLCVP